MYVILLNRLVSLVNKSNESETTSLYLHRAVASVKEARGHQFSAGGTTKSSAECASVEAPQAPRGYFFTFPCWNGAFCGYFGCKL